MAMSRTGGDSYASRYGAGLLLFGFVFSIGIRNRRKLILLLAAAALSAVLLASCGSSSSPSGSSAATGSASAVSYTVAGLSSNTKYYWKVEAVSSAGQQVDSPVSSFVTN